jgi:Flp pilus assembly protein TadG
MDFIRGLNRSAKSKRAVSRTLSRVERVRTRLGGGEEGQSVVEMALVLPALLFVLCGMLVFGIYFNNYLTLTEAVAAGAQRLQQIRSTTGDPCNDTFNALSAAAPNLNSSKIVMYIYLNGGSNINTGSGSLLNSCTSETSTLMNMMGDPVKVTATYPCSLAILGVNFGPSNCLLTASMTEFEY